MPQKNATGNDATLDSKQVKLRHPGSKRQLGLWIYDILHRYSSKENPMTYQRIIEKLQEKYNYGCMRSTLANYIHDFEGDEFRELFGCRVCCDKRGSGYYLDREIGDEDVRLLLDSILSMRALSTKQAEKIVQKLIRMASPSFQSKARVYANMDLRGLPHSQNGATMENIKIINNAIIAGHQVSFTYNEYTLGARNSITLKPRRNKRYIVNPYRLAVLNGRIYLVGNTDSHEDISTYRVDKMTKPVEEETVSKPWREIDKAYDPPKTMTESLYMFTDKPVDVEFWITAGALRDVVDWFGEGHFKIIRQESGRICVRVRCSETAMRYWAMSYGDYVEIVKPQSLRDAIREMALKVARQHE